MLKTILNEWFEPSEVVQCEAHDKSSGLSGSAVWKISARRQHYCLKRWPAKQFSNDTLLVQHQLLRHVRDEGFPLAPLPRTNRREETIVQAGGYLWDLTNWMPGTSLTRQSLRGNSLRKAIHLLARFHTAAWSFATPTITPSPGLRQRLAIVRSLQDGGSDELLAVIRNSELRVHKVILRQVAEHLESAVQVASNRLTSFCDCPLTLQWSLRDVKYDHVLFDQGRPSGLIDYGAAAIDSVSGDIARLVGSLYDVSDTAWNMACDSYCEVRSLSGDEREAITFFDIGGVVAAAANWLRWLVIEDRQFENEAAVAGQLAWLANRLEAIS